MQNLIITEVFGVRTIMCDMGDDVISELYIEDAIANGVKPYEPRLKCGNDKCCVIYLKLSELNNANHIYNALFLMPEERFHNDILNKLNQKEIQ